MKRNKAVVTGGRRGIGRALALALNNDGYEVTVIARSADRGDLPFDIRYISHDLSQDRAGLIGDTDVLINNAGISILKPALELSVEEYRQIIEVNLTAVFDLSCQAVRNGCRRIINLASISSFTGARGISAYASSKHGLIGLTKCLSNEWAKDGVTVNCIAPGFIQTDMLTLSDAQTVIGRIPAGRIGTPEDVVGAMLFLLSDGASYITGSTILVDGGWVGR